MSKSLISKTSHEFARLPQSELDSRWSYTDGYKNWGIEDNPEYQEYKRRRAIGIDRMKLRQTVEDRDDSYVKAQEAIASASDQLKETHTRSRKALGIAYNVGLKALDFCRGLVSEPEIRRSPTLKYDIVTENPDESIAIGIDSISRPHDLDVYLDATVPGADTSVSYMTSRNGITKVERRDPESKELIYENYIGNLAVTSRINNKIASSISEAGLRDIQAATGAIAQHIQ